MVSSMAIYAGIRLHQRAQVLAEQAAAHRESSSLLATATDLIDREDYTPAEALSDQAVALAPSSAEVRWRRGELASKQHADGGALDENNTALTAHNAALSLRPEFGGVYCDRADLWVQLDNRDAATEDYKKCLEYQPDNSRAYSWLYRARRLIISSSSCSRAGASTTSLDSIPARTAQPTAHDSTCKIRHAQWGRTTHATSLARLRLSRSCADRGRTTTTRRRTCSSSGGTIRPRTRPVSNAGFVLSYVISLGKDNVQGPTRAQIGAVMQSFSPGGSPL